MVFDKLENLGKYIKPELMEKLAPILVILEPDCSEGRYEVDGDKAYIKVQSYNAKPVENCRIEAHDQYIDIQSTLCGCEGICIFDRDKLTVKEPYSAEKDVVFFETEGAVPLARLTVYPGKFVMLL